MNAAGAWHRFGRWVPGLLPVAGVWRSLEQLAAGWRDICEANAAVVFSRSDSGACVQCATARGCGQCDAFSIPWAEFQGDLVKANAGDANGDGLTPALLRLAQISPASNETVLTAWLQADAPSPAGAITAGAVIVLPDNVRVESELIEALKAVSAGLIRQSWRHEEESVRLRDAKLESMAELAAGAGHEINNPLATIAGRAALLLRDESDPQRRKALATIGGQAHRIRDMIGDLMLFGRPPEPAPVQLDLAIAIQNTAAALVEQAEGQGLSLVTESAGDIPIWADPVQLSVVVSALLQNALDASGEGDKITVRSWREDAPDLPLAYFSVHNPACQMADVDREHLFDPFYSGRQAGRGLGFGLTKAWRIVGRHHGRIEFEGDSERGTTFIVRWPARPVQE